MIKQVAKGVLAGVKVRPISVLDGRCVFAPFLCSFYALFMLFKLFLCFFYAFYALFMLFLMLFLPCLCFFGCCFSTVHASAIVLPFFLLFLRCVCAENDGFHRRPSSGTGRRPGTWTH